MATVRLGSGVADATTFLRGDQTWAVPAASGAPVGGQYLVLATDATLTAERVLTGTANQVILTDAGAGSTLTLSLPQSIATTSTPQFARLGLGAAADASTTMLNAGASVVSAPAHKMTGAWFTGGSATTTKPHFLIEPTGTTSTGWSTAGTGLGINAPSGFTGNIFDVQLNGVSAFKVTTTGSGTATVPFALSTVYLTATGNITLFSDAGALVFGLSSDAWLRRDAANTLAQRNGTAVQAFHLYRTFTDASNYRRLVFGDDGLGGFGIFTSGLGTGISGNNLTIGTLQSQPINIITSGGIRWIISSTGHLLAGTDNTYDIGASGSTRPRNLYLAGNAIVANVVATGSVNAGAASYLYWGGRAIMASPADGIILLSDQALTSFNRLQFGSTTSSYPSIKRSGVVLEAKLADDSAYTQFYGGTLRTGQYTVAGLPAAATAGAGATAYVTDSLTAFAAALGAAVVGGGSNNVTVFSDGTNWIVG